MVSRKGIAGLSLVLGALVVALAGVAVRGAEAQAVAPVDYSGYAMVWAEATTPAEVDAVNHLGINTACRFVPGDQPMLIQRNRLDELDKMGLAYQVVADNAQAVIDQRARGNQLARMQRDATFYTAYRTIDEMSDLIDSLVLMNPAIAQRVSVGTSLEGRDIFGIVIKGVNAPVDAPKFVINACQHAREWVAPMAACYAAEQLVTQYGADPQITDLVDSVEFHIIPISNPDGYVYTWGPDRYWRKNRRNNGDGTYGVDLNRNYSYQWGGSGSSGYTGDETYRGPSPFSEPESTALANYMASIAGGVPCTVGVDCGTGNECTAVKAHLDIHTYGAVILGPWGWTDQIAPPRETELRSVQTDMESAMNSVNGYGYVAGLGTDQLLYIADGICPDWTFGVLGALSWTYELRPIGSGLSGFSPPDTEILPASTETFAGIEALAERIKVVGLTVDVVEAPTTIVVGEGGAPVGATAVLSGVCGENVTGVTLKWREQGGGTFTSLAMADNGTEWDATLPEQACGTTVEYYVEATGSGGEFETYPADAPTTLLTAESIQVLVARDDDFETDAGWTVGLPGDTATTGIWERADPEGTTSAGFQVQPEDDYSPDGTLCWVTGAAAGSSAGVNDVDGGATTLLSPVMDLSGTSAAEVSFELWYSNNAGAAPNTDTFRVDITDDGTNWVNALTVGPTGAATQGGWYHYAFQAEDFVGLNSTVRVRFVADDAGSGSLVEAALDEFMVRESQPCAPPACVGDLDGDGKTNVFDFGIFGSHFGQSVTPGTNGDFDSNGVVNVFDFGVFAGDFGCGV